MTALHPAIMRAFIYSVVPPSHLSMLYADPRRPAIRLTTSVYRAMLSVCGTGVRERGTGGRSDGGTRRMRMPFFCPMRAMQCFVMRSVRLD